MRYWWVSQNQTYRHEVFGQYMWSPKLNQNGGHNPSYDRMTQVQPGDVVFSFAGTYIRAIGIATTDVQDSPKPDEFGRAGRNWDNDGWLVEVAFQELPVPIKPKDHMNRLAPLLPRSGSPLRQDGTGNQAYLFEVPEPMALEMGLIIGPAFHGILAMQVISVDIENADRAAQEQVNARTDIGAVEKVQLIRARRGQGLFRIGVHKQEKQCRVTHVSNVAMLRASHIKPWRDSNDDEKLDSNNGLMLSPHVDLLFDQGFITFEGNGKMELSPQLELDVLDKWKIPQVLNVGKFNSEQQSYLQHHGEFVFRSTA